MAAAAAGLSSPVAGQRLHRRVLLTKRCSLLMNFKGPQNAIKLQNIEQCRLQLSDSRIKRFGSLCAHSSSTGGQEDPVTETELQVESAAPGSFSSDEASKCWSAADNSEQDLDCPTGNFSSISEAIEDIRQGKLVIVVDDKAREN